MVTESHPTMTAIPKDVQAIAVGKTTDTDGTTTSTPPGHQVSCCNCRVRAKLFRCTRCQVTQYCSRECQKQHFSFHKKLCKQVSTLRDTVDRTLHNTTVMSSSSTLDDSSCCDLINTLIVMGYRETDTIENATCYYQKALHYCLELFKKSNGMDLSIVGSSESQMEGDDLILLLLAILGASPTTIKSWCMEMSRQRQKYFSVTECDTIHVFTTSMGLDCDDFTFHMVGLLVCMRNLAALRNDSKGLSHHSKYSDITLSSQIQLLLSTLKRHGHLEALIHLRDTIPFSPEHAPRLAPIHEVPTEIWYLYQDCFFMTPGVNNILHEFLPEDEDPIF